MSFVFDLGDFVSRLNVAYIAKDLTVTVRLSRLSLNLAELFYRQGWIQSFYILDQGLLLFRLKYHHNIPLIRKIKLLSTPGHRIYSTKVKLARLTNKHSINSIYVLSTTVGLLTHHECLGPVSLGGEILLKLDF